MQIKCKLRGVMVNKIQTSIYQDIRRLKKDGTYPVKLRLYDPALKKTKLYPLGLSYTKEEFDRIWNTTRPKGTFKDERMLLQDIEGRAAKIVGAMNFLDLKTFERKFNRRSGAGSDVFYHFSEKIEQCIKDQGIGNAENYENAVKSFKEYIKEGRGGNPKKLLFAQVNEEWLVEYEKFMVSNGRSLTTVGIYTRALRTVFHRAIDEGEVDKELLPFGRNKYVVPASRKKKSALKGSELSLLFNARPENGHQKKARDFFFLSYTLSGMNLSDIAKLRWKDVEGEYLRFVRAKTAKSTRGDQMEVSIPISSYARTMFDLYGTTNHNPSSLIFRIHVDGESIKENRRRQKNFGRYINQHIGILAKSLGIDRKVSYQMARHSFATTAIRKGLAMEFVSEALGHKDLKTTQDYFQGFEDETKKEIAEKLLNF